MIRRRHDARAAILRVAVWAFGAIAVLAATVRAQTPAAPPPAPKPERVALMIGVSEYSSLKLPNVKTDMTLVSAALRQAGFAVTIAQEPNKAKIAEALAAFRKRSQDAKIALIYVAAAGVEVDRTQYVFPADTNLDGPGKAELLAMAVSLPQFVNASAPKDLSIFVFDAGRDNPFSRQTRGVSVLTDAKPKPAPAAAEPDSRPISQAERIVIYSSGPGEMAADGEMGRGSPFARAFAKRISENGDLVRVVGRMSEDVRAETRGGQYPSVELFNPSGAPVCLKACGSGDDGTATRSMVRVAESKICTGGVAGPWKSEVRLGFLIGNAAYRSIRRLTHTIGDVDRIEAALKAVGFQVRKCTNMNRTETIDEFASFTKSLSAATAEWREKQPAGVLAPSAFVYYSGHGVSDAGKNYLLPVGEEFPEGKPIEPRAVSLTAIVKDLAATKARLAVVVVDACRSLAVDTKGDDASKAITVQDARAGVLIGFSTQPEKTAPDSPVYSTALAAKIQASPSFEVTELFRRLSQDVRGQTNGAQRPQYVGGDYDGDYYFKAPPKK
jgi:uncharacterized caspase-like protein